MWMTVVWECTTENVKVPTVILSCNHEMQQHEPWSDKEYSSLE